MQFSFLIPFLFLIYKKFDFFFFLIFILVLYFFFSVPVFIFHFSMGIMLAINQDFIVANFNKVKINYKLILVLIIVFMYTYRYTLPMYYYYYVRDYSPLLSNNDLIWMISGLGSFCILLYCFVSIRLQKILNLGIFRFIGRISYAIYLTHLIVLIFLVPILIHNLNSIGITNNYLIWILSLLCLLTITTILSYFLTTYVEVPMARLGNNIIKKYLPQKST